MKQRILVKLPSGVPFQTGSFGSVTHGQNQAPPLFLFPDWDLIWVREGHPVWKLLDGTVLDVPENHFLLLPPMVPGWLQPLKTNLGLWYCHFSFHPVLPAIWPSVRNDYLEYDRMTLSPAIISAGDVPGAWQAFRVLFGPHGSINDCSPWQIERALLQTMSELADFALKLNLSSCDGCLLDIATEADSRQADWRLIDVCQRVKDNPGFPWKVSELAKSVGLSLTHLNRLCHSNLGMSLKQHIADLRLKHSLGLLNIAFGKEPLSIKEVATRCGFASQQFFAVQFKKFFNITPSQYRQRLYRQATVMK